MDNSISLFGSDDAILAFLKSSIESCNIVLEHYDFVINDISSNISNPVLENSKGPSISFLKAMRKEWQQSKEQSEADLVALEKKRGEKN